MEKWEYYTTFLEADFAAVDTAATPTIPQGEHPKHSPHSLMPALDELGQKGWELVHMQPVIAGRHHDVLVHHNGVSQQYWSSTYFCVFKRPAT